MKKIRKYVVVAGTLLFTLLVGCGDSFSKSSDMSTYQYNGEYGDYAYDSGAIYGSAEEMEYYAEESGASANVTASESVREGRKLIRTADLSVETLEFDKLLNYVENRTYEYGGYIESLDVYNGSEYDYYGGSYNSRGYSRDRNATMTIRIPKKSMDDFLGEVAEHSNITGRSEREQDVTLSYVDLESHKEVLLAEQERLLTFLEQAESVEDMISIEARLSDIRYQIESMERSLRTYDNQIEYSTIFLDITEVVVLTPVVTKEKNAWERISEGFLNSLNNIAVGLKEFFIGFVVALPYLVLIAVIVLLILWIIFFSIRRGKKKRLKKEAKRQEELMKQQGVMNGQPVSQETENRGPQ